MSASAHFSEEPEFSMDFAAAEMTSLTSADAEQKEEMERADPMNTGFMWYTPPLAAQENTLGTGEHWMISGHDMQVLSMTVPQGRTITTEVGSFFFGSAGIHTEVDFTCCSGGEGCERICGGESCVKLLLTNESAQEGYVGLTPNFPAKVIPLKVRGDRRWIYTTVTAIVVGNHCIIGAPYRRSHF